MPLSIFDEEFDSAEWNERYTHEWLPDFAGQRDEQASKLDLSYAKKPEKLSLEQGKRLLNRCKDLASKRGVCRRKTGRWRWGETFDEDCSYKKCVKGIRWEIDYHYEEADEIPGWSSSLRVRYYKGDKEWTFNQWRVGEFYLFPRDVYKSLLELLD